MAISRLRIGEVAVPTRILVTAGESRVNSKGSARRHHKAPNTHEQISRAKTNRSRAKVPAIMQKQNPIPAWKQSAIIIEDCKIRFIRAVPIGGNARCCQIDRSAILELCNEALLKVHSPHHAQILAEVMRKALIILNSKRAQPNDSAFFTAGAHLKPLDPRFAEPRINYHANEKEHYQGDAYERRASWRLRKWRALGWPKVYPRQAVEEERQIDLLGAGPKMLQALDRDVYWGDEVSA